VPNFGVRENGFDFPNWFPPGTPIFEIATPFGTIPVGDASYGLCGGMVFAALDFYHCGIGELPKTPEPALRRYFARRLVDSWNLPFGGVRYYAWQMRSGGLLRKTIANEWPRIRARLQAGVPVALGLVKARGHRLRNLSQNHQVLAYGYDFDDAEGRVTLRIYDPNYAGDETATLSFHLRHAHTDGAIEHSCEGPTIRGIFLTTYRKPVGLFRLQ